MRWLVLWMAAATPTFAADGAEEAKVHGVQDPQQATEELGFYDRLVPYAAEGSTGTKVYVGNGGAGLAGFLGHLAEDFQATPEGRGIDIVWVKAHTDENYAFMRDTDNPMQLAMTYNLEAEAQLAEEGVIEDPGSLVFLDHFQVVGPKKGLKSLGLRPGVAGVDIARALALRGRETGEPLWLFRVGESATSVRAKQLFASAGHPLTDEDFGTWVVEIDAYPPEALDTAAAQGLFTLTDVGTTRAAGWKNDKSPSGLRALATGTDSKQDPLLNPCSVIVKAGLPADDPARVFAAWVLGEEGQASVARFNGGSGAPYYAPAGALTD